MSDMDALSEFCAGLTPADVEPERLAPLAKARKEFFSGAGHRQMLEVHELNRAKAALKGIRVDPATLRAEAVKEAAEYMAAKARRAELRRKLQAARERAARRKKPAVVFTREQIDAALARETRRAS